MKRPVIATAQEDIPAGAMIELDLETGKARMVRSLGVPVIVDEAVPPGTVEYRDSDGNVVAIADIG